MQNTTHSIATKIKELAKEIGFTDCGIAPARELTDDAKRMRTWLENNRQAGMQYMENHFEKRTNPSILVPGAKSVIVVLLNYYPQQLLNPESYQIAKYAYGRDYHKVMKKMLKKFRSTLFQEIGEFEGRAFVDSAPVLERSLAAMAGLGWVGKNANLISPKHGSFVFIGEIMVDIVLEYDHPMPDYCGGCQKCISACPTEAIISPQVIDSRKCIPYWTIEHNGEIDPALKSKLKNWIFGCDICQDVCPWNRKSKPTEIDDFQPSPNLIQMTKDRWKKLSKEEFDSLFYGSAVKRTKYEGFMRNIQFVALDD